MKRIFSILLIIGFCFLVIGCTKEKRYTIKIVDFSILHLNISRETNYLKHHRFVDKKEPKHQILQTNFGEIEAEYIITEKVRNQFFYIKEFKDENGNLFDVNDSGIITMYSWLQDEKEMINVIDENQAIEIANEFIKKYNYLDFNDYMVTVEFRTDFRDYIVSYTKYINELRTCDSARITVDEYGNLLIYSSSFLGMIPTDLELDFDYEIIKEMISSRLDNLLADYKEKYYKITYDFNNYHLIMLDYNQYGLVYDVIIRFYSSLEDENNNHYDSDIIRFLVQ